MNAVDALLKRHHQLRELKGQATHLHSLSLKPAATQSKRVGAPQRRYALATLSELCAVMALGMELHDSNLEGICMAVNWTGANSEARGFPNLDLVNRSLFVLFSKLTPDLIRPFTSTFELTRRENNAKEDPVIRAQKIARRLVDHYRLSASNVIVSFRSDIVVPARVELSSASECFVNIHSDHRNDVQTTVALLAHEVAHIFLHRAGIRLEPTFHNEVLTDTTAVFLGCGPVILNGTTEKTTYSGSVTTTRVTKYGYLTVDEFGYVQAKREAFFCVAPTKKINFGISRLGYVTGRRRFKSQLREPPFAPPSLVLRCLNVLGLRKASNGDMKQQITFACGCCSQTLRVPRLGKTIVVHCPVCQEAFLCHS